MTNLKTLVLILALLLLPDNSFCKPSLVKDSLDKAKEAECEIAETSHNAGRELAPDKVAATSPIENHANGGAKEGGEADKQIIETESIRNRMEHQHIGSGLEKTKIAASEHDLSTHHEKALENLAQKQADYDSMTKLLDWTNRETRIVFATQIIENAPELHVEKSGIETLKEIDEELTVVANAALSIYGPPKTPPEKSLILKSSSQLSDPSLLDFVKVYKEGIPRLFELLYTPATLPPYYSYVGLASKSCILKMFDYLSKYKMMPTDLEDGFKMTMKSPSGLEWIAKEMQGAFLPGSKYGLKFHVPLNEAEFLENHPHLSQLANLYKGLGKKEQNYVMFHSLKLSMTELYDYLFSVQKATSGPIPIQGTWHMNFLGKMEKILLKEFEPKDSHANSVDLDFSEVQQEILNCRKFLVDPAALSHNPEVQHHLMRYSFLILNFMDGKLGRNYVEKLGLKVQEHDSVEYQTAYEFMKSTGEVNVWKNILMDYGWTLATDKLFNPRVNEEDWEEKGAFYWTKFQEAANHYASLSRSLESDPQQAQLLKTNSYIQWYKAAWDSDLAEIHKYYEDFRKLVQLDRIQAHNIPESYLP
ncbi:hypothetical protein PGT21_005693 [Puccinia graminis f. sp. tritici]|uniref:Uncharacterized protein n=1 Tax=Puccinia graminis f. sp. tritici TaxID=56615 RepID=A0A5B0QSI2_PUCGR|nr:hypothetical protein PGT21_005693 [Puccinia graminis f. sp. tritici]